MPKTRINCPNCRQPIMADIDQLFDAGVDPEAKQRLLSGAFNIVECPSCGYQGNVATPVVYHDPVKELLITFVPTAVGLARDDQERMIGTLINQVVNNLPQEMRKAYLFRPSSALTMQGLVEQILEADGITREMIQAQQQRLNLIQRLMSASPEERTALATEEDAQIDADFFGLLRRLVEASLMGGDQNSARQLADLQQQLLPVTTFGREMQAQAQEVETAVSELRALGKDLTREKLLSMVENAPNETRVRALVGLTRPAMDYAFFQLLSEHVDQAAGEERERLTGLREKLLQMTSEIDQQMEEHARETRQLFDAILQAEDVSEAMLQSLPAVDDGFLQELNTQMEAARKQGDLEKLGKLQKMVDVLQQASAAPPEIGLIEDLLDAADDQTRRQMLEEHQEEVTPEFMDTLANIMMQVQSGDDQELADRLKALHRVALRFSMEKNIR